MTRIALPTLSLKSRITLATLCILLVSLWALSFISSQALRQDTERLLGEQQSSAAGWVAAQVENELKTRIEALERKAATASISMRSGPEATQDVLDQSPILQMLFTAGAVAYGADGHVVAQYPAANSGLDINPREIEAVSTSMKRGRPAISLPVPATDGRTAILGLVVPIWNDRGAVIGALAGRTDLTKSNFLSRITDGRYGRTGGFLVIAPTERLVLTATDRARFLEVLKFERMPAVVSQFLAGQEGYGVIVNARGVEVLASARQIPFVGWFVAATLPTREAFEPIRDMQRRMVIITLGLTLLAALFTGWVLKTQLSPLTHTAKALAEMSESNEVTQPLPSKRDDEIGKVIAGFNRLLDTLGRRESALRDAQLKYRELFEKSPIGLAHHELLYDASGEPTDFRILDANQAYVELFGIEPLGKTARELFPDLANGAGKIWLATVADVIRSGRQARFETYVPAADRWCDCLAYKHESNEFFVAFLNITERKRAEDALRDNEMKLEAIFNASPAAMSVSDANNDYRTIAVNMAWERQFRRQRDAVIGKNSIELGLWADPADRSRLRDAQNLSDGVGDMEAELVTGDGQHILCMISSLVTEIHGSRLQLMVAVDITERRRIENELQALNADLEARVLRRTEQLSGANAELAASLENLRRAQDELLRTEKLASLGALVAGIAHELNTPIGNAVTVASTLLDLQKAFSIQVASGLSRAVLNEFIDDVGEAGQILDRNLNRAVELVGSFKQLAVDQSSYQRRSFDLHSLVHEIMLAMAPTFRKTQYTICDEVPRGIVLDSYPGPLGQILMNLINNALVHGFEGRETGTIRIQAESKDGVVLISVGDDGRGIPAEHQARIFDPFFTTRLGQGGSGLGLHIVFNLVVELLGGRIDVSSTPGEGSVFTLRLPVSAPEAKTAQAASQG